MRRKSSSLNICCSAFIRPLLIKYTADVIELAKKQKEVMDRLRSKKSFGFTDSPNVEMRDFISGSSLNATFQGSK